MDEASARGVESAHAPTLANTYQPHVLEALRDDAEAARRAAEACVALSREHGLALSEALALARETGEHWFDAGLGEILRKQDPTGPAPAEAAFLAVIAVAQQRRAAASSWLRAVSRQAPSIDRQVGRRARRSGDGAARIFADAGVGGDRLICFAGSVRHCTSRKSLAPSP
jgi:hypothetical protein